MSNADFIEKLLNGADVEWKALGKVLVRTKGTKITAGQMKELHKDGAPVKIFAGGKTVAFVDFEDIPVKDVNREPSVIVKSRGVIEFEYYEKPFSHKNEMWSYHTKNKYIHIKYVYYFLKLNEPHFQNIGSKMQMPQIATPDTDKFEIPIPSPENPKKSLEIQAEIVRILDAFTALTTELTTELTARKKQYNHYRDQLLSSEDKDVEWKTLGSLVDINTGSKPPEILESATSFDYINAGTSRSGYSAASNCSGDTVTTPSRGQGGIGYVGYQNKPFWLGPLCYKLRSTDLTVLINKYLFYFLQSRSEMLLGLKKEGGVPAVNKSDLVQLEIPVPSVEEQKRIVAILDKFDALTNSITEGLPREIELRQKQYAYYRDLLLNFSKPEGVEV
ncbi:restriction endonuclease subunit S [Aeromonas jandaei]|uniref:restriction endonuclease subunit S n=1 Tax=Aeromonas jandaei TaxID=650 RepID=UPI001116F04F|nr:restriction endonuclease subunit S [Aeromonas jandaei]TNH98503.1 restriction endonuclease subunit S [Aeromonas jandaei]